EGLLLAGAEARVDRGHLGEDDEPLRSELGREECRGVVLVDDRVDPVVPPVAGDNRNAAASDGDHHHAALEEGLDRIELAHLQWFRGRYDPAPAAARVLPHRPAALLLELPGSV